jgi:Helix-turn-helix domain
MQQLKRGGDVEDAVASVCETPSELVGLRAYRIPDVCAMTQLGRTSVYEAIKSGELVARKWGRCTVVLAEDLAAFLRNLPTT